MDGILNTPEKQDLSPRPVSHPVGYNRDTLLLMFQKGVPRVMVDHGKINTKLSFYLTNVIEKGEETKPKLPTTFISKPSLPRLTVKPVSNRTPEFLTLKIDVIGEVEITFKTISV